MMTGAGVGVAFGSGVAVGTRVGVGVGRGVDVGSTAGVGLAVGDAVTVAMAGSSEGSSPHAAGNTSDKALMTSPSRTCNPSSSAIMSYKPQAP